MSTVAPLRGFRALRLSRLGRDNQSSFSLWFWEIDHFLLLLTLLLIGGGLVAVAAASPASAMRYSDASHQIPPMYYFWRQLLWSGIAVVAMIATSMLPVAQARRLALLGAGMFLLLLIVVPVIGTAANGARRWISFGAVEMQPSEFFKPLFIVGTAWLLSLRAQDYGLPVVAISGVVTLLVIALLMLQPDFGQAVLFGLVWLLLLVLSGVSPGVIAVLIGGGLGGVGLAYFGYGNAHKRIDAFLFSDGSQSSGHYQTAMAHATITGSGFIGTGPGGGTMKFKLPEAHTDYIFSVIGEEFGLIACAVVALLYLLILLRVFFKLLDEEDLFRLLAAAGIAAQFGLQALINMAVNTGLAPSKGMTLPFISYGGSSMVALSIGMGLLLAFTRRNPYLTRSPYNVRRNGQGNTP